MSQQFISFKPVNSKETVNLNISHIVRWYKVFDSGNEQYKVKIILSNTQDYSTFDEGVLKKLESLG